MPSARNVLLGDREQLPTWLLTADEFRPDHFFSSRIVYYPGSGTDGHAFELLCGMHSVHCVLHIDYDTSAIDVKRALSPGSPHHIAGYRPCVQSLLTQADAAAFLALQPELCPHCRESFVRSALWTVLERQQDFDDQHGPKRIAFLHVQADAIWVCCSVWSALDRSPFAVVIQDHGYGGNWTTFGGENSPLYTFQRKPQQAFPRWLLVAENTDPWPGYYEASDPTPPAGMGPHRRKLYRQ